MILKAPERKQHASVFDQDTELYMKTRCKSELKLQGSMTIEITLLMPILIGVFLFLFFTSYYLHDSVAYEKACNTALLRGSLAVKDGGYEDMEKAFREIRVLGNWSKEHICKIEDSNVSVSIRGVMDAPEGLFRKLIKKEYILKGDKNTGIIDEVTYIRNAK